AGSGWIWASGDRGGNLAAMADAPRGPLTCDSTGGRATVGLPSTPIRARRTSATRLRPAHGDLARDIPGDACAFGSAERAADRAFDVIVAISRCEQPLSKMQVVFPGRPLVRRSSHRDREACSSG